MWTEARLCTLATSRYQIMTTGLWELGTLLLSRR
ncbi:peroxisomal trans-2-enoyl-CoA reductase, isoform CRA_d [Rattus norvegicus]|uniref:Peroxisomal trans-2-enoyl-CoA reductase, isoform CRA_d n=1 Tax=Rattus norvegicus TaxID=10116 RepID=A6KFH8_RAT|nr:peroxisomal trans-2-enoyl-CoA reductase, isoform CRA_d [Rattus norvegicus]